MYVGPRAANSFGRSCVQSCVPSVVQIGYSKQEIKPPNKESLLDKSSIVTNKISLTELMIIYGL